MRIENHAHAAALHSWHSNFARKHLTLRTTPTAAAGLAATLLTVLDFVDKIEQEEKLTGARLTD